MIPAHKPQRVALVTAGAAGIGRSIANQLVADGLRVHLCDIDEDALRAAADSHECLAGTRADVSRAEEVENLFGEIGRRYGRLDVLVNNAGIAGPVARVEDIEPADWRRTVEVDLNGVFYVTRGAVPLLKRQGGAIVNIASSAALFGYPWRSPYAACKWALIGLTKTWAMELGSAAIRVNAVCPGSVNGPRLESVIERDAVERGRSTEEIREIWTRQVSLRRFVDPVDVAALVSFLASDRGALISGQAIGVDGHTESLSSPLD